MITLQEKAYAKLNLTLDVLGKRDDGYHDLESVMQQITLCDDIEIDIETGEDWKISTMKHRCLNQSIAWSLRLT